MGLIHYILSFKECLVMITNNNPYDSQSNYFNQTQPVEIPIKRRIDFFDILNTIITIGFFGYLVWKFMVSPEKTMDINEFEKLIAIYFLINVPVGIIGFVWNIISLKKKCTYRVVGRFVGYKRKTTHSEEGVHRVYVPQFFVNVNGRDEIRTFYRFSAVKKAKYQNWSNFKVNPNGWQLIPEDYGLKYEMLTIIISVVILIGIAIAYFYFLG